MLKLTNVICDKEFSLNFIFLCMDDWNGLMHLYNKVLYTIALLLI